MNGVPRPITAKIMNYGMVPAGVYNLNLEVQSTDTRSAEIAATSAFNLQFIVPVTQKISLNGEIPKISVGTTEIKNKVKRINNESSPMVYINSNANWVLSIKTGDFDNGPAEYYVRTVTASSNVNERLQEKIQELAPNVFRKQTLESLVF